MNSASIALSYMVGLPLTIFCIRPFISPDRLLAKSAGVVESRTLAAEPIASKLFREPNFSCSAVAIPKSEAFLEASCTGPLTEAAASLIFVELATSLTFFEAVVSRSSSETCRALSVSFLSLYPASSFPASREPFPDSSLPPRAGAVSDPVVERYVVDRQDGAVP